ncbi:conserved hypothetical protein [Neospora caninum Liverpool]|uniref:Eukaryotic translation initiation factor 2A n=2 Tax=Sarcocystidae TaxID=5809 RepID=F0VF16_NEOCL|nr:conserved hypothetical protein [Neospora caninum Liverpool]CBZ52310.1 conserved hypothetical protein [Neospora caninum Liverpool]CEL66279.1 TPA: GYF domain-containing protein [Neospora caninum Liverpool]|eukprot:XP_003882342.1 conserved hypothetical protein [Neospora caninum Liverpool]
MDRSNAESGTPRPDRGVWPGGGSSSPISEAGLDVKSGCIFFVQEKRGLRLFQVLTAPSASEKKGKKKLVELLHQRGMQQATWSPCGRRLALVSQDRGLVVFEHPTWTVADVSELWRGPAALASYCEKSQTAKTGKGAAAAPGADCTQDEKRREEISQAMLKDIEQFALRLPEGSLAAASLTQPKYLQWSPLGTYLVAFYNVEKKKAAEEESSQDHNVFVWNVGTKEVVASFFVRRLVGSQWPLLKWRDDELFCCIASRNCIQVFSGHDLKKMLLRFPVPRVFNIELAPCFSPELEQELLIGAFCPAAAAGPCSLSSSGASQGSSPNPQTAQFYVFQIPNVAAARASACEVDWVLNPQTKLQELLQAQRTNFEKTEAAVKAASAFAQGASGVTTKADKKGGSDSEAEDKDDGSAEGSASRLGAKAVTFHTVEEKEVKEAVAAASPAEFERFDEAVVRCVVRQVVAAADSAELAWSPSGTGLLVMANTTVDAAGENYGGVGDCWYFSREPPVDDVARLQQIHAELLALSAGLSARGATEKNAHATAATSAAAVQALLDAVQSLSSFVRKLSKKVAQDAKWSPTRDEFVLIEGKSPSDIYLLDKQCHVRFSFPPKYRNTITWGPFGQMVAIGGFGNLAGELSFWYRDSNVRGMSLITEWRAACTVQSVWAPSGDMFLTASTYPRMKVDNVFRVFDYEGEEIASVKFEELYKVSWKPESDLSPPPAPQRNDVALEQTSKGFYRPKNAQGILARVMRGELDESALPEELRKKPEETKKKRGAAGASGAAGSASSTAAADGASTAPGAKKAERDWGGLLDWRLQAKEENRTSPSAPGAPSAEAGSEEGHSQASKVTPESLSAGQARERGRSKGGAGAQSPAPTAAATAASGDRQGSRGAGPSKAEEASTAQRSRDSSRSPASLLGAVALDREEGRERKACFSTLSSPRGESVGARGERATGRGRTMSDIGEALHIEERRRDVKGKEPPCEGPPSEGRNQNTGSEGGDASATKSASEEAATGGADPRSLGLGNQQLSAVQQLFLQGRVNSSSFFQALQSASSSSLFRPPQPAGATAAGAPQAPFASYPGVIGPSSRASAAAAPAASNGFSGVSPRDAPIGSAGPGAAPSFNKAPGPAASQPSGHYEELLRAFRNIVPLSALHVLQESRSHAGASATGADARGAGTASGAFGVSGVSSLHGGGDSNAAVASAQAALGAALARLQQSKGGAANPSSLPSFFPTASQGAAGPPGNAPSAEAAAFYAELASRVQQRGTGGASASLTSSQLLKQHLLQQFARQQGQVPSEESGRFAARGVALVPGEDASLGAPPGPGEGRAARQPVGAGSGPQGSGAGSGAPGGALLHAQEVMQLLEHLRRGNTAEAVQFAQGSRAVWSLLQAAAQKQKLQLSQMNQKGSQPFQQGPIVPGKKGGSAGAGAFMGAGAAGAGVHTPGAGCGKDGSGSDASLGIRGGAAGAQGVSSAFANSSFPQGATAFLASSFGAASSHGGEVHVNANADPAGGATSHAQAEGFLADFMALQLQRKSAESAGSQALGKGQFPFPVVRPAAGSSSLPPRAPPQETRSPTSLAAVTAAAVDALTQQYPQLTKEQAVLLLQKLRLGNAGTASQAASLNSAGEHRSGAGASSVVPGSLASSGNASAERERLGGLSAQTGSEGVAMNFSGNAAFPPSFSSFAPRGPNSQSGGGEDRGAEGRAARQTMRGNAPFDALGEDGAASLAHSANVPVGKVANFNAAQRNQELLNSVRSSAVNKTAISADMLRGWGAAGANAGNLSSLASASGSAGGFEGAFSGVPPASFVQDLRGLDRSRDSFAEERRDAFGAFQDACAYLPRNNGPSQVASGDRERTAADMGGPNPASTGGATPGAGAGSAERGKRPDAMKDKCWQYVDPKGNIQGPFHREEMAMWNAMGYFDPALPVRCCGADRFIPLNKLYPPPQQPFSTTPKPQPMHIQ